MDRISATTAGKGRYKERLKRDKEDNCAFSPAALSAQGNSTCIEQSHSRISSTSDNNALLNLHCKLKGPILQSLTKSHMKGSPFTALLCVSDLLNIYTLTHGSTQIFTVNV